VRVFHAGDSDLSSPVKIVQFGMGPIGVALAKEVLSRADLELAGAVDRAPGNAGKPLDDLVGPQAYNLPRVVPNLGDLPPPPQPRVVLHATGSRLKDVMPQLEEILSMGYHCVSSCEELSYPFLRHADLGERLDDLARRNGVGLVAAGINPGFALDLLPAVLATACRRIDRVEAVRSVEVTDRREPLQLKVGMGLDLDAYRTKEQAVGGMGHVGLAESAALLASALGWSTRGIEETSEPVIAQHEITMGNRTFEPGTVLGTRTRATLKVDGEDKLLLQVTIAAAVGREEDHIMLEGDPTLELVIPGGIPGDSATASIMASMARRIVAVPPGLHSVLTLPVVPPGPPRLV
jgi:4-hydroxy-tetrahydrodipicolinate reductase